MLIKVALAAATVAFATYVVVGAQGATMSTARSGTNAFEASLIAQINVLRREHDLKELTPSSGLFAAARQHDAQMIQFGYFGHSSPDGSPFWRRVENHYPPHLHHRWEVGENLLSASPGLSPQRALAAWLASPAHRTILLNPAWREIGLVVLHVSTASGVFGGAPTTVITADFGIQW